MPSKKEVAIAGRTFEELKQVNKHDAEYWSARDLQPLLGYSQWRRFEQAVERSITSCQKSGNPPEHHFAGAGKPITGGKGAVQVVVDYQLSRTLEQKLVQQKVQRELEGKRSKLRRDLFNRQDEVEDRRNTLIGRFEQQLEQRVEEQALFSVEWALK